MLEAMVGLTATEQHALTLFKERILQEFPEGVDSLQLFGSKARGEAAKHSDVDVLVVLHQRRLLDRGRVSRIAAYVLLEQGVVLSTKTFGRDEVERMKRHRAMFWQAIQPDLTPL